MIISKIWILEKLLIRMYSNNNKGRKKGINFTSLEHFFDEIL